MRLDSFRVFPVCSGHEIRRDLLDLVTTAHTSTESGATLRADLPRPCLDLLWTTDAAPEATAFRSRLHSKDLAGAALFAKVALEEVLPEIPPESPPARALRRLLAGEALEGSGVLLLAFDDRDVACLGWVARRTETLALFERLWRLADHPVPVLVRGETGTGKEIVARALHRLRRTAHGPWTAINCAELPETLLESELFGHVRGAFTGASSDRPGLLEAAAHGTAFLDEIGELRLSAQAKLLRVLEEHHVRRIGGARTRALRCRVVAATNRNLVADVARGQFRADLFYRLRGTEIVLPPLRRRAEDVPELAGTLLTRAGASFGRRFLGFSEEARLALLSHSWPGNVRELRQAIDAAALAADGEWIRLRDLSLVSLSAPSDEVVPILPVRTLERRQILRALASTNGNKVAAARLLGLTRQSLQRRLDRHGIAPLAAGSGQERPEPGARRDSPNALERGNSREMS